EGTRAGTDPTSPSTPAPPLPQGSASDLGNLICVLAFLPIHQLALAGADQAALLRPHPADPFRLDLRAELQETVDQGFRADRTAGNEDVRGYEWHRPYADGVVRV